MRNNYLEELGGIFSEKEDSPGTRKQIDIDIDVESIMLGYLIQDSRHKKKLTKKEVAMLLGTSKSYISKLERGLKDVRYSTLQRIVRCGLGGRLKISIELGQDRDIPF